MHAPEWDTAQCYWILSRGPLPPYSHMIGTSLQGGWECGSHRSQRTHVTVIHIHTNTKMDKRYTNGDNQVPHLFRTGEQGVLLFSDVNCPLWSGVGLVSIETQECVC